MKGVSTYTLKNLTDDDIYEIKNGGFRIFSFCEEISTTVVSIYKTIVLFGHGIGILPFPINNEKRLSIFWEDIQITI